MSQGPWGFAKNDEDMWFLAWFLLGKQVVTEKRNKSMGFGAGV